ncbi:alpha-ketoacid dehydrogenase subunit beta [Nitrobacter sp. TKz-YC02]|uniref:alpha-ketoacid dehydrogenase subunit beta n=1 Tax=Nitrobacter sp. TKz-YC02 TaxID=3398704 RepID=UPI003CE916D7
MNGRMTYAEGIRSGFGYLFKAYPNVFAIGQGLWSPWYVGSSMTDLDKEFGRERVIDSQVSELSTTGAAVGASLFGYRPIVIHPRIDFMLLAVDQIVNQAAKWHHMLGGQVSPSLVIRAIINRGGEQGAQHSQALHSWFAHIPGLRVVMPATATDARDLLIAATLCNDPVLYIDDRWLYDWDDAETPIVELDLARQGPRVCREGTDLTIAAASFSVRLAMQAADELAKQSISAEVVDVRVLNPLDHTPIVESVRKTGRLLAVDGGWRTCGFAGELLAVASESLPISVWKSPPRRVTLVDAPAPTSKPLEDAYYTKAWDVVAAARSLL